MLSMLVWHGFVRQMLMEKLVAKLASVSQYCLHAHDAAGTRHAAECVFGPFMQACSICQSEYEPDEVIMILPCEHHFHKDCAMEWLGKHSKKCPICKELIGG